MSQHRLALIAHRTHAVVAVMIVVFGAMTIAIVSRAAMTIALVITVMSLAVITGSLLMMFTRSALSDVNIA